MTIKQFGISITVGVMACLLTSSCGSGEQPKNEDKAMSSYGTAVSSSAILQGDQHVTDTRFKAAKGQVLEGQRPAIADPSAHVAPTATQPVFGFKPIDPGSQDN